MKALNVLLALLVSALIGVLVLEGGLRLIGKGPTRSLVEFDPATGWSKRPDFEFHRSTPAFDVTIRTNAQGLHDDPMPSTAKPPGTFRVLALGDSFTQGFSVDRAHLFVDRLEAWWQAEGRKVEIVNAGTEAFDTAQEVAWLLEHGAEYDPDLVLLFPYQNDLYWNSQTAYMTGKGERPKPRFDAEGNLEADHVLPPDESWLAGTAVGGLFAGGPADPGAHRFEVGGRSVHKEFGPLLQDPPAFQDEVVAHTRGALRAFQAACAELGAEAVVVPIPDQSLYASAQEGSPGSVTAAQLAEVSASWSANRPVQLVLGLCEDLGLRTLDPRPRLREAADGGTELYYDYRYDWHFNPAGNAVFASFLHDALDTTGLLPPPDHASPLPEPPAEEADGGLPFAAKLYLGLWLGLTLLYWGHYKDEPKWLPPLRVGALLAVVFGLVLTLLYVQQFLPPALGKALGVVVVVGILGFVAYKMGNRLATILELLKAFTLRGHWYLMPLVVVLLTIGSLLVVAASSPLVAPFIYTLF